MFWIAKNDIFNKKKNILGINIIFALYYHHFDDKKIVFDNKILYFINQCVRCSCLPPLCLPSVITVIKSLSAKLSAEIQPDLDQNCLTLR